MRRSFDELWQAMEARRQQVEAGAVPPAHGFDETRQARRQSRGCPDEETLCGWVDGELRRNSLRRWLMVWQHIQIRRCRDCQAEVAALDAVRPAIRPRLARPGPIVGRVIGPWHRVKTPLAWGSSALVIMIGLSLWSFDVRGTLQMDRDRSEAPLAEDASAVRTGGDEHGFEAQTEPVVWGD